MIGALEGIELVLCAKIGDCPKDQLSAAGIAVSDAHAHDYIESAISAEYQARFDARDMALTA